MLKVLCSLVFVSSFAGPGTAATFAEPPAINEDSIQIVKIGRVQPGNSTAPVAFHPAGKSSPSLGGLINLGKKAWSVIDDNRPVVDVGPSPYATALPAGISSWRDMANWSPATGSLYELSAKNTLGVTVIRLRYIVKCSYGGSYNDRGHYLTSVSIEPLLIDVAWGYRFSLKVEVPETGIINIGTSADPMAAMSVQMKWAIRTPLRETRGQSIYYLQGDGLLQDLSGRFRGSGVPAFAPDISKG